MPKEKRRKEFSKHCPKCNGLQWYYTERGMKAAERLGHICHSCAAKENAPEVAKKVKAWRKSLTPRQRKALSKKYSEGIRRAWAALPEEEKERRREVTRQCQIEYHANRSVEERDAWLKNLKASFKKWRGKNHWMNRVETMAKVHASYMKYTGKNHWRHRPGVHEKILATLKHNKHIKETCGEL